MRISPTIGAIVLATLINATANAQELVGRIIVRVEAGQRSVLNGVRVRIVESGRSDTTNDSGLFRLPLSPPGFQAGDDITIEIVGSDLVLLNASWRLPRALPSVVEFEAVQKGHPSLLAPRELMGFMERYAQQKSAKVVIQERAQRQVSARNSLQLALKEFALARGFGIDDVQERLDEWARDILNNSQDIFERGLAALAQKRFIAAATEFSEAAETWERRRAELLLRRRALDEEIEELDEDAFRARLAQAQAYAEARNYTNAHATQMRVLGLLKREEHADRWASLLWQICWLELKWADDWDFRRAKTAHTEQAILACQGAAERYTKGTVSWAFAVGNLGHAWLAAARANDELGVSSDMALVAAKSSFNSALEVFSRDTWPLEWGMTHNNIGSVYLMQGRRLPGEPSAELFSQAIAAHRLALEEFKEDDASLHKAATVVELASSIDQLALRHPAARASNDFVEVTHQLQITCSTLSRERDPILWARAQGTLGLLLLGQSFRSDGDNAYGVIVGAVSAFRASLEGFGRDVRGNDWAMSQSNLGDALVLLGGYVSSEEREAITLSALMSYERAIEIYDEGTRPIEWAWLQYRRGGQLITAMESHAGKDGRDWLTEGIEALRASMRVYTKQVDPDAWANVQMRLGLALGKKADLSTGNYRRTHSEEAAQAFRASLEVLERDKTPGSWAWAQASLAIALERIAAESDKRTSDELLEQAIAASKSAIEIFDRSEQQQMAAWARMNLGYVLRARSNGVAGDAADDALAEAVHAYRDASNAYSEEADSERWEKARLYEVFTLTDWSIKTHGAKRGTLAAEALAECDQILSKNGFSTNALNAKVVLHHDVLLDFETARQVLEDGIRRGVSDVITHALFAQAMLTTERFDDARRLAEKLRDDMSQPRVVRVTFGAYVVVINLLTAGQEDGAWKDLLDVVAENSDGRSFDFDWNSEGVRSFIGRRVFRHKEWCDELLAEVSSWRASDLLERLKRRELKLREIGNLQDRPRPMAEPLAR